MEEKRTESIPEFLKNEFNANGSIDGHEFVDLGLPSGLKWATCNIGASSPQDYGDYFSWGETDSKDSFVMSSYAFASTDDEDPDDENSYFAIDKYNETDGKTVLDVKDDVAAARWKGPWRMPSIEDFKELIDNCEWIRGIYNGTVGFKVKGPSGFSIFLPAAGIMEEEEVWGTGEEGWYWSSNLDEDGYEYNDYWDSYCAQCLYFDLNFVESEPLLNQRFRELGLPVRPVCK